MRSEVEPSPAAGGALTGMRAVILAGGLGTRLAPYTSILPKPLLPLGDMPILEILIRQLRRLGIQDVTLCVNYLAALLQAYFGDGARWATSIRYSLEMEPLGTAGPLGLIDGLNDTFLVMNGDLLTTLDFAAMVDFHRRHGAIVTLGLFRRPVHMDFGVIESDESDRVLRYVEKPTLHYDVSVGVYVMEPAVLHYVEKGRHRDLPDLVKLLISKDQPVLGYRFAGQWLDLGRADDYAEAVDRFSRERALFLPDESHP